MGRLDQGRVSQSEGMTYITPKYCRSCWIVRRGDNLTPEVRDACLRSLGCARSPIATALPQFMIHGTRTRAHLPMNWAGGRA
ncbi:MAG: hypothetical protein R3D52_15310 [Xanthobacteraceae bacterium]